MLQFLMIIKIIFRFFRYARAYVLIWSLRPWWSLIRFIVLLCNFKEKQNKLASFLTVTQTVTCTESWPILSITQHHKHIIKGPQPTSVIFDAIHLSGLREKNKNIKRQRNCKNRNKQGMKNPYGRVSVLWKEKENFSLLCKWKPLCSLSCQQLQDYFPFAPTKKDQARKEALVFSVFRFWLFFRIVFLILCKTKSPIFGFDFYCGLWIFCFFFHVVFSFCQKY